MSRQTRRKFLATAGTALAGTALAVGSASAARSSEEIVSEAPTRAVQNWMYPTMGRSDDNPYMTIYGNYKCPYTRDFVRNHLPAVVEEYVESDELNLRFRSLVYEPDPDDPSHGSSYYYISDSDPDIARSAYGVWNHEDENYWAYHWDLFEDQPSGHVTAEELKERMQTSSVRNWGKIRYEVIDDRYQYYLERTRRAAAGLGISWTPTAEFMGDLTPPHHGTDDLFDWIDARL